MFGLWDNGDQVQIEYSIDLEEPAEATEASNTAEGAAASPEDSIGDTTAASSVAEESKVDEEAIDNNDEL